jgi:hypothetical protein
MIHVSEMLGIPVPTLYRWRYKGDGPVGYRVGRHVRYRREAARLGWNSRSTDASEGSKQSPSGPQGINQEPSQSGPEGISRTPSAPVRALLAA